jgi:hypothetical protein
MSSQIDLIAIISPKAGKVERVRITSLSSNPSLAHLSQVVELLNEVSKYVQNNEPGTTKYQINVEVNKKSGVEEVIMLERSASLSCIIPSD